MLIKTWRAEEYLEENQFDNILRLFDVSPNFDFTKSDPMGDYYIWTWYIRVESSVAKRLKTLELSQIGNIRKVSKLHRMTA